ncbi:GNAT family N-acetyltransferase [Streptomyces sp. NPDC005407]|uniref:GNAT family N-acetyltransferase n=1 Tax=Streptomyces sp. NPDC005407 TaxID=3155340 RepID=UPI0033A3EF65
MGPDPPRLDRMPPPAVVDRRVADEFGDEVGRHTGEVQRPDGARTERLMGLCEVAVRPPWQSQGIGSRLHATLLKGIAPQWSSLLALPSNQRGHDLYARLGYTALHDVTKALREWALPDLVASAEQIVSELVTNALKHSDAATIGVSITRIAAESVRIVHGQRLPRCRPLADRTTRTSTAAAC